MIATRGARPRTELGLVDRVVDARRGAARGADLVILCVPVGAMADAAESIAGHLPADAIVSDVGSSKAAVAAALRDGAARARGSSPPIRSPAPRIAGRTPASPACSRAAGASSRPEDDADAADVERLSAFWSGLGAKVEMMEPEHHDLVLAVTSHLPHLIAFTIVGTASDLERVTESEVIKYSAGGFRDFTRIAASNPTMWRDVFLTNKEAVLDMLQRFTEDLSFLQRAIRLDDGDTLFDLFTRTRAIRRGIVEQGQDVAKPDFGRQAG